MSSKKSNRKKQATREGEIILYTTPEGVARVEVFFQEEKFWLSQRRMAELFNVEVHTINYHLKEIYASGELQESATIRKIRIVQNEGGRSVAREVDFYNLDAIIAVGYRVNSRQATQFRIWATQVLREFIIKGFVLDDERLKQGKRFGKDYFDELLERIQKPRRGGLQKLGATPQDKSQPWSLSATGAKWAMRLFIVCVILLCPFGALNQDGLRFHGALPRANPFVPFGDGQNLRVSIITSYISSNAGGVKCL